MDNLVADRTEQDAGKISSPPTPYHEQDRSLRLVNQNAARMPLDYPGLTGDGGLKLCDTSDRRLDDSFGFIAEAAHQLGNQSDAHGRVGGNLPGADNTQKRAPQRSFLGGKLQSGSRVLRTIHSDHYDVHDPSFLSLSLC